MEHTRKLRAAAAMIPAVALLVGWLVPFGPASAGTQLEVLEGAGFSRYVDEGKQGFSPGDTIYEVRDLLDPSDAATLVGTTITRIEIMRRLAGGEDAWFYLDCTVRLSEGTIVFTGGDRFGSFFDGDGITFSVVGGTGAYALARGTVVITPEEVGGAEGARFAFDLTTT